MLSGGTSEGGGRGVFHCYLRRYTSVGAETACASLRVCAPSPQHSRISSDAMTHPPARDHRPPRSISGHQKGAGGVCFTALSANTPLSFLGGDILHLYHAQEHTPHPCRNEVSAHTQNKEILPPPLPALTKRNKFAATKLQLQLRELGRRGWGFRVSSPPLR